jgi:hypothetical protein
MNDPVRQRRAAHAARKAAAARKERAKYRDGKGSARVKVSQAQAGLRNDR